MPPKKSKPRQDFDPYAEVPSVLALADSTGNDPEAIKNHYKKFGKLITSETRPPPPSNRPTLIGTRRLELPAARPNLASSEPPPSPPPPLSDDENTARKRVAFNLTPEVFVMEIEDADNNSSGGTKRSIEEDEDEEDAGPQPSKRNFSSSPTLTVCCHKKYCQLCSSTQCLACSRRQNIDDQLSSQDAQEIVRLYNLNILEQINKPFGAESAPPSDGDFFAVVAHQNEIFRENLEKLVSQVWRRTELLPTQIVREKILATVLFNTIVASVLKKAAFLLGSLPTADKNSFVRMWIERVEREHGVFITAAESRGDWTNLRELQQERNLWLFQNLKLHSPAFQALDRVKKGLLFEIELTNYDLIADTYVQKRNDILAALASI
jgi:hypothetical protein